jgi:hypothetical protein
MCRDWGLWSEWIHGDDEYYMDDREKTMAKKRYSNIDVGEVGAAAEARKIWSFSGVGRDFDKELCGLLVGCVPTGYSHVTLVIEGVGFRMPVETILGDTLLDDEAEFITGGEDVDVYYENVLEYDVKTGERLSATWDVERCDKCRNGCAVRKDLCKRVIAAAEHPSNYRELKLFEEACSVGGTSENMLRLTTVDADVRGNVACGVCAVIGGYPCFRAYVEACGNDNVDANVISQKYVLEDTRECGRATLPGHSLLAASLSDGCSVVGARALVKRVDSSLYRFVKSRGVPIDLEYAYTGSGNAHAIERVAAYAVCVATGDVVSGLHNSIYGTGGSMSFLVDNYVAIEECNRAIDVAFKEVFMPHDYRKVWVHPGIMCVTYYMDRYVLKTPEMERKYALYETSTNGDELDEGVICQVVRNTQVRSTGRVCCAPDLASCILAHRLDSDGNIDVDDGDVYSMVWRMIWDAEVYMPQIEDKLIGDAPFTLPGTYGEREQTCYLPDGSADEGAVLDVYSAVWRWYGLHCDDFMDKWCAMAGVSVIGDGIAHVERMRDSRMSARTRFIGSTKYMKVLGECVEYKWCQERWLKMMLSKREAERRIGIAHAKYYMLDGRTYAIVPESSMLRMSKRAYKYVGIVTSEDDDLIQLVEGVEEDNDDVSCMSLLYEAQYEFEQWAIDETPGCGRTPLAVMSERPVELVLVKNRKHKRLCTNSVCARTWVVMDNVHMPETRVPKGDTLFIIMNRRPLKKEGTMVGCHRRKIAVAKCAYFWDSEISVKRRVSSAECRRSEQHEHVDNHAKKYVTVWHEESTQEAMDGKVTELIVEDEPGGIAVPLFAHATSEYGVDEEFAEEATSAYTRASTADKAVARYMVELRRKHKIRIQRIATGRWKPCDVNIVQDRLYVAVDMYDEFKRVMDNENMPECITRNLAYERQEWYDEAREYMW